MMAFKRGVLHLLQSSVVLELVINMIMGYE